MISPIVSRRRNTTLVVRREDALRAASGSRGRSRRARRQFRYVTPTRFVAIAVAVLVAAVLAWLFVFAHLLALVN